METIETVCMSQQGSGGNFWVKNKQCKEHTYEATCVNKNIKPYVNWIKHKNIKINLVLMGWFPLNSERENELGLPLIDNLVNSLLICSK